MVRGRCVFFLWLCFCSYFFFSSFFAVAIIVALTFSSPALDQFFYFLFHVRVCVFLILIFSLVHDPSGSLSSFYTQVAPAVLDAMVRGGLGIFEG